MDDNCTGKICSILLTESGIHSGFARPIFRASQNCDNMNYHTVQDLGNERELLSSQFSIQRRQVLFKINVSCLESF